MVKKTTIVYLTGDHDDVRDEMYNLEYLGYELSKEEKTGDKLKVQMKLCDKS